MKMQLQQNITQYSYYSGEEFLLFKYAADMSDSATWSFY